MYDKFLHKVIETEKPDIVHVFGAEYCHGGGASSPIPKGEIYPDHSRQYDADKPGVLRRFEIIHCPSIQDIEGECQDRWNALHQEKE